MMKKDMVAIGVCFFAILAFGTIFDLFTIPEAQAAVFVVDATVADGDPGSLRDAVDQANAAIGADTIELRPGRYILDKGQLEIRQDLSIKGSGACRTIIDGNGNGRVLFITAGDNPDIGVKIRSVTITGGKLKTDMEGDYGGGIYNEGELTINYSKITKNSAQVESKEGGYSCYGGGIFNRGHLSIKNSEITKNVVKSEDFYSYMGSASGGGIYNRGNLFIQHSRISENKACGIGISYGGGICHRGTGKTTIKQSIISRNGTDLPEFRTYYAYGGGIYGGKIRIYNSKIIGNTLKAHEEGKGGGIYGGTTLINSTVARNYIESYRSRGGGIYSGHELNINGSKIAANKLKSPVGEIYGDGYGGGIYSRADLTINYSIIIGNTITKQEFAEGGGIYQLQSKSVLKLKNSKIIRNTVNSTNNVAEGGGLYIRPEVLYTIEKSIVRKNRPDQIYVVEPDF